MVPLNIFLILIFAFFLIITDGGRKRFYPCFKSENGGWIPRIIHWVFLRHSKAKPTMRKAWRKMPKYLEWSIAIFPDQLFPTVTFCTLSCKLFLPMHPTHILDVRVTSSTCAKTTSYFSLFWPFLWASSSWISSAWPNTYCMQFSRMEHALFCPSGRVGCVFVSLCC